MVESRDPVPGLKGPISPVPVENGLPAIAKEDIIVTVIIKVGGGCTGISMAHRFKSEFVRPRAIMVRAGTVSIEPRIDLKDEVDSPRAGFINKVVRRATHRPSFD